MKHNLTNAQLDALKEATNIGAGHAAIALSQLIGRKIMIAVTDSRIIPSD
ncbi:MAG: chemotaxis protein CheC, partial [Candidatus Omnitrophota bacterium]